MPTNIHMRLTWQWQEEKEDRVQNPQRQLLKLRTSSSIPEVAGKHHLTSIFHVNTFSFGWRCPQSASGEAGIHPVATAEWAEMVTKGQWNDFIINKGLVIVDTWRSQYYPLGNNRVFSWPIRYCRIICSSFYPAFLLRRWFPIPEALTKGSEDWVCLPVCVTANVACLECFHL